MLQYTSMYNAGVLKSCGALKHHELMNFGNIASSNDMLPDGTKPLSEP